MVWGYHRQVSSAHVSQALAELGSAGLIRVYTVGSTQYVDFPSWRDHQRISHPMRSKLPSFEDSGTFRNVPESSGGLQNVPEDSGAFRNVPERSTTIGSDLSGTDLKKLSIAALTGGGQTGQTETSPNGDFEAFYRRYPRRVGRLAALRAWTSALKRASAAEIMAGLERQLPELSRRESKYIPHPSTWLNQGRWQDETDTAGTETPWFGPNLDR
jgi:hypothetical protein